MAPCLRQIFPGERSVKGAWILPGRGKREPPQVGSWGSNCKFVFISLSVWKLLTVTCFLSFLNHYFLWKKKSGMLLLGFSNTPMDKTYQIFMVKYKEAHILQRSSHIKEPYGRNVLPEIFIFSLLLFHLCGFLHLGTTAIIPSWATREAQ